MSEDLSHRSVLASNAAAWRRVLGAPEDVTFDEFVQQKLKVPVGDDDLERIGRGRLELQRLACTIEDATYAGLIDQQVGDLGVIELVQGLNRLARHAPSEGSGSGDFLTKDDRAPFSHLLREPSVSDALVRLYEVRSTLSFANATLHRLGTSSFLVKCQCPSRDVDGWDGPPAADAAPPLTEAHSLRALKCVFPQYWEVDKITEATKASKCRYDKRSFPQTPRVHESGERYVVQDFVDWDTLAEIIPRMRPPKLVKTKLTLVRQPLRLIKVPIGEEESSPLVTVEGRDFAEHFVKAVCKVLRDYREPHLDLSPSNIFVRSTSPDASDIKLIDFGRNFVVQERVGTTRAYQEASLYMSPEILEGSQDDDTRSDVYSLGVCLLQVLAGGSLTVENFRDKLDRLWVTAPGWARLIEDMVAENPNHRLSLMRRKSPTSPSEPVHPYTYISKVAEQESKIVDIFAGFTEGEKQHSIRDRVARRLVTASQVPDQPGAPALFRWWQTGLRQRAKLRTVADKYQRSLDDSYQYADHLAFWAGIAAWWWTAIWFLFFSFTALDLFNYTPSLGVALFDRFASNHLSYALGDFWSNIPGRLVAFTFGIDATAYYLNIFSTITLRQIRTKTTRRAERAMRACALLLALPIMVTLIINPDLWPYMSALGAFVVVVNNYLMLQVAREAKAVERRLEGANVSSDLQVFEDYYREWWTLMALYLVALVAVGVLITVGKAHDGWFYAACVALGVNMLKLYRLNSLRDAPGVRANLSRATFLLRRAEALRLRG